MEAYDADHFLHNKDMVTAGQVQIILLQKFQMANLFLLKGVELSDTKKGVINKGGLKMLPLEIVRLVWTELKQPL